MSIGKIRRSVVRGGREKSVFVGWRHEGSCKVGRDGEPEHSTGLESVEGLENTKDEECKTKQRAREGEMRTV